MSFSKRCSNVILDIVDIHLQRSSDVIMRVDYRDVKHLLSHCLLWPPSRIGQAIIFIFSPTWPHSGLLAAVIVSLVLNTPATVNGFRVCTAL